ncbi:MAG: bifunctional glutamate N-acetyltransferase/amino-acid acetyltransferase ArgJ [Mageeibacillus sp.]|jgi:glutamate N-acetyltransferase/amino-acid N-acetyltransferase|nr:bifunctional glutamate N-acetyltransferase/amino-acid acetyltransferase ArgJ [Mageeibacillus sp.]
MENESIESYITMPKGFKAAGIACGLKGNGSLDLNILESDIPATVAGVYTSNIVKGHSLQRTIDVISKGNPVRAVIVNARNANACVGRCGYEDAELIAGSAAGSIGCKSDEILTASTGVIGIRLPAELVISGIPSLVSSMSSEPEDAHNAERAMMTTDTMPKEVSATITLADGKEVTIAGMAKGSGMICPNLATMIGLFTTDCAIDRDFLSKCLSKAVSHTFNRVSVDGDTSVCDMVLVLANGASGASITAGTEDADLFEEALTSLSLDLAKMIASDGEGASKFIEVEVTGAASEADAKLIVSAVAKSPLCKTAIFGEDANWGRILTALGYSGAKFDPNKVDCYLCGLEVCRDGAAADYSEDEAAELMKAHDINISLVLHEGEYSDRMFTCDFTYDYVKINGSYRS